MQHHDNNKLFPGVALLCPNMKDENLIEACDPSNHCIAVFVPEMVATFLFITPIMHIKYHTEQSKSYLNTLGGYTSDRINTSVALSFILLGILYLVGGITGACLNPTIGLVQTLYQNWVINNYPDTYDDVTAIGYKSMWIYILAPFAGGALAAFFNFFHEYAMRKMKIGFGIEKY